MPALGNDRYPYGPPRHKVCVLGASGGIGQPISLLLKMNPLISELSLYDVKNAATPSIGIACDLSHINTKSQVVGSAGDEELSKAVTGSSVVVMVAGVPRKPGMTRDDLFKINAGIARGLAEAVAKYAPTAMVLVITNPVNSTVPIVAETLKKRGVYDWRKLAGVTSLDLMRAATFVAERNGRQAAYQAVPCVCGHAAETIVPLFSQADPALPASMTEADLEVLDKKIQEAGTEVVEAKGGAGSATLSMAAAGARFVDTVLMGLSGVKQTDTCYFNIGEAPDGKAFGLDYFATKVEIGPNGIMAVLPLGKLTAYEEKRINEGKNKLKSDIKVGIDFAKLH
jgi:malate dehydrogenase